MAVFTLSRTIAHTANGVSKSFGTGFQFIENNDVEVYDNDVLVSSSLYTLIGAGEETGGTVTFNTVPTAGHTIRITRKTDLTQASRYTHGPFPPETLENDYDKSVLVDQELREQLDRSLHIPIGEDNSMELPSEADRANSALTFDSNGDLSTSALEVIPGIIDETNVTVADFDQHSDATQKNLNRRVSRSLVNHADYTGGIVTGYEVDIIVDQNARDVTLDGRTPDGSPEAPFMTIKAACEHAQVQGSARRLNLKIKPGIYEEDNPIQIGNGARITGTTAFPNSFANKPAVVIRPLNQGKPIFDVSDHQYSGPVMSGHFYMWVDVGRGTTPGVDGHPDFSNVGGNWTGSAPVRGEIFKATADAEPTDWGTACLRDLALVTTWADCQFQNIFFDGILKNGLNLDAPAVLMHRAGILHEFNSCHFRHVKYAIQCGTMVNGLIYNCFGGYMGIYDGVRDPVVYPTVGYRGIWEYSNEGDSYAWDAELASGTIFQVGDYVTRVARNNNDSTLYRCITAHTSTDTWSITGTHAGATHATILTAASGSPFGATNSKVGMLLRNTTDGSSGIVTANTGTTATVAALTGGSSNDWFGGDATTPADAFNLGDNGYWESRTRDGDLEGAFVYNDFTFYRAVLMNAGEEDIFGTPITSAFSLQGDSTALHGLVIINFQGDHIPCLVKAKHNSSAPGCYTILGAETESTINIHHWEHFLELDFAKYGGGQTRSGALAALKVWRVVWCSADTDFSNLPFVVGRDEFAVGPGAGDVRVGDRFVLSGGTAAERTPAAYGHAVVIDEAEVSASQRVFIVNITGIQNNFGSGQLGTSQGAVVAQINTSKTAAAYSGAATYYPGDEVEAIDVRDGETRIFQCITQVTAGGPWSSAIQVKFVESEQPRVLLATGAINVGGYPYLLKNYETNGDFQIPVPTDRLFGPVVTNKPFMARGHDSFTNAFESYYRAEALPRYCLTSDGEIKVPTNLLANRDSNFHPLATEEAGFGWFQNHRVSRFRAADDRWRYETTDFNRRNYSNSNVDAWQPHQTAGNLVHTGWYEVLVVAGVPDFRNVCTISRNGSGNATAGSAGLVLENSAAIWRIDALIGLVVINETDGSIGIIASNTGTTVTAEFLVGGTGGTPNTFANTDAYRICTWGMLNFGFVTSVTPSTTVMNDSNGNWGSNFFGTAEIYNITKGASATISLNGRTSVTSAALSGGASWEVGDKWFIAGRPDAPLRHDVFQCIGNTAPTAWGTTELQPLFRIPRMHTYPPWLLT